MTYIPKEEWLKLDILLEKAGCCGYHDFCLVLKLAIKEIATIVIENEKDLKNFLDWLENEKDIGVLKEKLSIYTTLLQKK